LQIQVDEQARWRYLKNIYLLVTVFGQGCTQPIKSFVKSVPGGCASSLNVPVSGSKRVKSQLVSNFSCGHCIWQILLVCKDKNNSVAQFILVNHFVEFFPSRFYTIAIITINYKNQTLCVLIVMAPKWTNLILTTYIPNLCNKTNVIPCFFLDLDETYRKTNVLVINSLDIEPNGRDCRNDLP